jgi:uncharacterized protein YciI
MPVFALMGRDGPQGLDLRGKHREAHLANLRVLVEADRVLYAGPLLDPAGSPCGSLVVFEADSLAQAQAFAASDPYVIHGVFASHEVIETRRVFPEST